MKDFWKKIFLLSLSDMMFYTSLIILFCLPFVYFGFSNFLSKIGGRCELLIVVEQSIFCLCLLLSIFFGFLVIFTISKFFRAKLEVIKKDLLKNFLSLLLYLFTTFVVVVFYLIICVQAAPIDSVEHTCLDPDGRVLLTQTLDSGERIIVAKKLSDCDNDDDCYLEDKDEVALYGYPSPDSKELVTGQLIYLEDYVLLSDLKNNQSTLFYSYNDEKEAVLVLNGKEYTYYFRANKLVLETKEVREARRKPILEKYEYERNQRVIKENIFNNLWYTNNQHFTGGIQVNDLFLNKDEIGVQGVVTKVTYNGQNFDTLIDLLTQAFASSATDTSFAETKDDQRNLQMDFQFGDKYETATLKEHFYITYLSAQKKVKQVILDINGFPLAFYLSKNDEKLSHGAFLRTSGPLKFPLPPKPLVATPEYLVWISAAKEFTVLSNQEFVKKLSDGEKTFFEVGDYMVRESKKVYERYVKEWDEKNGGGIALNDIFVSDFERKIDPVVPKVEYSGESFVDLIHKIEGTYSSATPNFGWAQKGDPESIRMITQRYSDRFKDVKVKEAYYLSYLSAKGKIKLVTVAIPDSYSVRFFIAENIDNLNSEAFRKLKVWELETEYFPPVPLVATSRYLIWWGPDGVCFECGLYTDIIESSEYKKWVDFQDFIGLGMKNTSGFLE